MHLYKTTKGNILIHNDNFFLIDEEWDKLINRQNLFLYLSRLPSSSKKSERALVEDILKHHIQPPIGNQELWAAGVTYLRSRDARMDESAQSGGGDFYQRVYDAERPELFFKALPHRIAGDGQEVFIRKDSTWNVPEPELSLFINSEGNIEAYTIGNDMSSRSIEGENPLYLPQAKSYEKSAALGPCLLVIESPISNDTLITIGITRQNKKVFEGSVQLNRMKRTLNELVSWLFKECTFPNGCFLMTGTGIVPPDDFTLLTEDEIKIHVEGIGTLTNKVAIKK